MTKRCYNPYYVKTNQDLSEEFFDLEILKDLEKQGYEGEELDTKFQESKGRIKQAVEAMIDEADRIAKEKTDDGNTKLAEIFRPD